MQVCFIYKTKQCIYNYVNRFINLWNTFMILFNQLVMNVTVYKSGICFNYLRRTYVLCSIPLYNIVIINARISSNALLYSVLPIGLGCLLLYCSRAKWSTIICATAITTVDRVGVLRLVESSEFVLVRGEVSAAFKQTKKHSNDKRIIFNSFFAQNVFGRVHRVSIRRAAVGKLSI